MNKTELVKYIANETGLTQADSARALEAMMSGVVKGLKKEGKVSLPGFCTFATAERPARMGRNPRTGEPVKIAARTAVTIKAGKTLKDSVN
jgi:DNA-binding protein HU-beta